MTTTHPNHHTEWVILTFLLILTAAGAVQAAGTDFRSAYWGMTRSQVMETEPRKPLTEGDAVLTYQDTLSGIPVEAVYVFHPWQHYLTQGLYIIREDSTQAGNYIPAYQKLYSLLRKKFGDPVDENTPTGQRRQGDAGRRKTSRRMADSLGFVSRWQTKDTIITLELKHAPEAPPLTISYMSTNYLFTRNSP